MAAHNVTFPEISNELIRQRVEEQRWRILQATAILRLSADSLGRPRGADGAEAALCAAHELLQNANEALDAVNLFRPVPAAEEVAHG